MPMRLLPFARWLAVRQHDADGLAIPRQRQAPHERGRLHAGDLRDAFDDLPVEVPLLRSLPVLVARQPVFERQQVFGLEAGVV